MFDVEATWVRDSSTGLVTRRSVVGALAGGLAALTWTGTGQTRKKGRNGSRQRRNSRLSAQATGHGVRPIGDFIDAQGTTFDFVPPVADVLAWTSPLAETPLLFAWVDYAGVADGFQGLKLGTRSVGTIIEKPLPNGRAEVRVILHTHKALAWVIELDLSNPNTIRDQIANKQPIFGYRPQEIVAAAKPKPKPSLVEVDFQLKFINTAPGADLPDLVKATFADEPDPPDGFDFLSVDFRARGLGTVRAGNKPGRLKVEQVGVNIVSNPNFSLEVVEVKQLGK
jgi:hypothetical protein